MTGLKTKKSNFLHEYIVSWQNQLKLDLQFGALQMATQI